MTYEHETIRDVTRTRPSRRLRPYGLLDRIIIQTIAARAPLLTRGRLDLALPGGTATTIGGPDAGVHADLTLNRYRVLPRLLYRGKLGFAESYLAGDVDTSDLRALFDLVLDNETALAAATSALSRASTPDQRYHASRRNTRNGSRRNIAAHYDLGNAFYRQWLDAGMSYSSGIYRTAGDTLEIAQAAKQQAVIDALELRPGHRLLDIGCGWGGMLEAAARVGAEASGITISREQLEWTNARLAAAAIEPASASVAFLDYRDSSGTFDRVTSIEMIEAVGEDNWPTYFAVLADRLASGGIAVIQAITIRDEHFEDYRRTPDFIQRYVFPGGMLPTETTISHCARTAGLSFEPVTRFGNSYVRTLDHWRERFERAWPTVAALGFDERFRRLWSYYLIYCAVGFERGLIDVGLYRLRKR